MPREARRSSQNGIYHIMLRGINRQTIFEDDEDKLRLLETMKRFKNISEVEIYAYCLMDNHVHLLIKETQETVSKAIQRISSSYYIGTTINMNVPGICFREDLEVKM